MLFYLSVICTKLFYMCRIFRRRSRESGIQGGPTCGQVAWRVRVFPAKRAMRAALETNSTG